MPRDLADESYRVQNYFLGVIITPSNRTDSRLYKWEQRQIETHNRQYEWK